MTTRITRSAQLGALIFEVLAKARMGWREYAIAVVDHYHASVLPEDRVVDFQVATTAAQFEAVVRNNTQTVRRHAAGERTMPADLEESLIAALPESHRERVLTALLSRNGLMYARTPPALDDGSGQVRCATDLMRRAADAVDAVAPMLADQRIGPEDAPHMAPALAAINGVMSACCTLNAQIHSALAMVDKPAPRIASRSTDVH